MTESDIYHAWENSLGFFDIDRESEPRKSLCIGPDCSGNLLEVLYLELGDDGDLVIHAMQLRPVFSNYLLG